MSQNYYIVKREDGMYYRGKGENKWGQYYNQATIYRIKGQAEQSVEMEAYRGNKCKVVEVEIKEIDT